MKKCQCQQSKIREKNPTKNQWSWKFFTDRNGTVSRNLKILDKKSSALEKYAFKIYKKRTDAMEESRISSLETTRKMDKPKDEYSV